MARLQEVLCDGENYGGARPCHFEWVKALRDECAEFDVTFVFCGTGRVFVKDGRTYHLEGHLQSEQARKSGMSYEDEVPLLVPLRWLCEMLGPVT